MATPRCPPSPIIRRARRALGWALLLAFCLLDVPTPTGQRAATGAPDVVPAAGEIRDTVESPNLELAAEVPARIAPTVPAGPARAATPPAAIPPAPVSVAPRPTPTADAPESPAPSPDTTDLQEGMFELVVDGVQERTLVLVMVDERGDVFIPVREVLERVEIPVTATRSGLTLEWPRGVWHTHIDLAAGTLAEGDAEPAPLGADHRVRNGALYFTATALESLIDASVQVVWSDLVIHVAGQELPVMVRRRREVERRIFGSAASPFGPDPLESVPFEARTGGLAATWGLNAFAGEGVATHGTARMALGGSLWGGAIDFSATAAFAEQDDLEVGDFSGRFSRPVFGSGWLSRVDLGAVSTGGALPRRVLGGSISNEPYLQPRYFGATAIDPVVPSGWDYEVYQGNHLVGTSDAAGVNDLRADVNYGHTPVRVRMLGPAGQEVVRELLFVVNPRQVPAGALRYDLSAGACRDAGCDTHAAAEMRYGLNDRLTLGAGAERLDPASDAVEAGHPDAAELGYHVSAVARPLPNLSADVRFAPGAFLQAGAQFMPSRGTNATASYLWQGADPLSGGFGGWQGRLAVSGPLPLPGGERHLSANVFLRGDEQGKVDAWRAGVSTGLGRSYVSADVERGLQTRSLLTLAAYTPVGDVSNELRDLAINAAFAVSANRAESLEAGVSFRPTPGSTMQAGVRLRQGDAPRLTLSFSTRASRAFAQARVAASERHSSASLSLDGGAVLGGAAGASFFALPGTGQAGVSGRVFIDLDRDGVRDSGEPLAADIPVSVGGYRVRTDAEGAFESWGLRPYEAVSVHVDSLSLDFDLKPAAPEVVVRPSPNRFHTVDLPLVRTREVTGWVVGEEGRTLGGVTVEVVDEDGAVVATGRTFSDGEVYIQRVPVGSFTLRVADASLRALGAEAGEVAVMVAAEGDGIVQVPTLAVSFDR